MIHIDEAEPLWPPTCHGRWMSEEYEPGLVSVIILTYNRAHFLIEAMDSVWNQTYRPIELIVVDDGSTDDTQQVVERWGERCADDDQFELRCFHQENKGAPAARNLGLIESHGEYIQYLDSDDLLHHEKLMVQVCALQAHRSCDFVWSATAAFEETPDFAAKPYTGMPRERLLPEGINSLLWQTASGLYRRRACLLTGPWHEGLKRWQDWEYYLRLLCMRPCVRHVPGTYFLVRSHATGRINDFYRDVEGLTAGVAAVQAVESTFGRCGLDGSEFGTELAKRYYRLARRAMRCGVNEVAQHCLHRALSLRTARGLWLRLHCLRNLHQIIGPRISTAILDWASSVRKVVSSTTAMRGLSEPQCNSESEGKLRHGKEFTAQKAVSETRLSEHVGRSRWPTTSHERWMSQEYQAGLVSVIIPTYNRARFLIEAMDSVWNQTYRPIELIVVDDGSTDATAETVQAWKSASPGPTGLEVRYLYQRNMGPSAARNAGLMVSNGEYVQFLDSDDLLCSRKIGLQVNVLSQTAEQVAAYGPWRDFVGHGQRVAVSPARRFPDPTVALTRWLRCAFAPSHSFLWRRRDLLRLGPWDEGLVADEDGEYGLRFLLSGGAFVHAEAAWVYRRRHHRARDCLSRARSRRASECRIEVAARLAGWLAEQGLGSEHRAALAYRYYSLAVQALPEHRKISAACLAKSAQLSPTGEIPCSRSGRTLIRLLGLANKQRLKLALGFCREALIGTAAVVVDAVSDLDSLDS